MKAMNTLALVAALVALSATGTSSFAAGKKAAPKSGANAPETNAIAAEASPKSSINRVTFVEPVNGAKVSSKFKVKMGVDGYTIAPVGTMTEGTGHHHLIVDGGPIAQGTIVPTDKTHLHFGKGQTETELELPPGKHKLTLQFANGAHQSYGAAASETIEIEVTK